MVASQTMKLQKEQHKKTTNPSMQRLLNTKIIPYTWAPNTQNSLQVVDFLITGGYDSLKDNEATEGAEQNNHKSFNAVFV